MTTEQLALLETEPPVTYKVVDGFTGLISYSDGRVEWSRDVLSNLRLGMTLPAPDSGDCIGDWGRSDEMLRTSRRRRRREMEDLGWDPKDIRVRRLLYENYEERRQQLVRFCLRMRYGARCPFSRCGERGTDVYDHYMRLGQPPSYVLALLIDQARWKAGERTVLSWTADGYDVPQTKVA
jgi:hypothetical protein